MRDLQIGTFAVLVLVGLSLIVYFIPAFTPEDLGYGLPSSTLPYLLASFITFFSFLELVKAYRNKEDKRPMPIDKHKLIHLMKIIAICFATFPLMELVTFLPAAIVSIIALQWVCGQRNYKTLLSVSIILSISLYCVSTYVLFVPLP